MLGLRLISAEAGQWAMPGTGGVGCPALRSARLVPLSEGVAVELVFQLAIVCFSSCTGVVTV